MIMIIYKSLEMGALRREFDSGPGRLSMPKSV